LNSFEFAGNALRRAGVRIGVLVGVLAVVGVLGLLGVNAVIWFSGIGATQTGGCGYPGGGGGYPGAGTSPLAAGPTGEATDEQKTNAAIIVGVGQQLQVPERGQWIALATALQESGLRNIDYGDRDSVGLFQQRPSQGWGSVQQILDPVYSATQFYNRLLEVPDWPQMELWQAAQAVQRSAFPTAYSKWENLAASLLAEGGTDVSLLSTDVCAPRGGATGPAALAFIGPDTGCVVDDPTSGGCLTANTRHALDEINRVFGGYGAASRLQSVGCWDAHAWNPSSDHPKGKACDLFPGSAGVFAAGDELQAGWELAEWLRGNAESLHVAYIIWQGRIWSVGRGDTDGGWGQPYGGGGVYDPDEATGGHFDHVHVSFQR
jgi:hypothetical protein